MDEIKRIERMKVLYDHQMFSIQTFGGVSRYFTELIKHLPEEISYDLPLFISNNQYLKEHQEFFRKRKISLPANYYFGKSYVDRILFNLNERVSVKSIKSKNYDLFHPTFYNNYFLQELKTPFVITVHDLIVFEFKNKFFQDSDDRKMMKNVIKRAERVIAISNNTKNDIVKYLNINPDKIDVVYHGYTPSTGSKSSNQFDDYILYVGNRARYKNFSRFAKAISPLLHKEKDLKLICVGEKFTKEEVDLLNSIKIAEQTLAMHVDEKRLSELYSHSRLFIYPSLYEGFGMPILEAMANNCAVCLSNTSCFPEIAGTAGEYFDPYDEESILASVEKVFYSQDYRRTLIDEGRKRVQDFSWSKTAAKTLETYKKSVV